LKVLSNQFSTRNWSFITFRWIFLLKGTKKGTKSFLFSFLNFCWSVPASFLLKKFSFVPASLLKKRNAFVNAFLLEPVPSYLVKRRNCMAKTWKEKCHTKLVSNRNLIEFSVHSFRLLFLLFSSTLKAISSSVQGKFLIFLKRDLHFYSFFIHSYLLHFSSFFQWSLFARFAS